MKWQPIPGYETRYEVSDRGDVRSILKNPPRDLKPFMQSGGYLAVNLYAGSKSSARKRMIHDLVAEAFIGPKPAGMTVNHKDGNKTNNRPSNLEYLTQADNTKHAHRTGLINNRGENHPGAKLKEHDVYLICSGYAAGQTITQTAKLHGVSYGAVWRICMGRTWVDYTVTLSGVMCSGSA